MQEIVKVGEKGQITMPAKIREKEEIHKGTLLEVIDLGSGDVMLTKFEKKKELELALKLLGDRLTEKKYTKERLIALAREIRREVHHERVARSG